MTKETLGISDTDTTGTDSSITDTEEEDQSSSTNNGPPAKKTRHVSRPDIPTKTSNLTSVKIDGIVLVKFDVTSRKNAIMRYFLAQVVIGVDENEEAYISYLKRVRDSSNKFTFTGEMNSYVPLDDIVRVENTPYVLNSREHFIFENYVSLKP